MKVIFFLGMILISSCKSYDNCDSIEIDSNIDSLSYIFKVKVEHPFKKDGDCTWRWNDTIILNGFKVGPKDTSFQFQPDDYYGKPEIDIRYQRYKAMEVYIKYTYCFY